ncbi:MAG: hypothetical protein GWN87_01425, partial [Desulfuromonadales bacterium]|nr:hypothetical protein [Desulfuromonadales bacterium]
TEIQAAIASDPDDPLLRHTLGVILRGMGRFDDAADAFERHIDMLPKVRETLQLEWARSEARFLRAFGARVPFEISQEQGTFRVPF